MTQQLQTLIDNAWENRANISATAAPAEVKEAVEHVISQMNKGQLRVATREGVGHVVVTVSRRDERDENDRRKVYVAIVPEALAKVGRFYEPLQKDVTKDWDGYTDAELKLLLPFMTRAHAPISLTGMLAPFETNHGTLGELTLTSWRYLHQPEKLVPRALRKLAIARGLNNLWNKGGIQYAPPIR